MEEGINAAEAIARIRREYCSAAVETPEQVRLIYSLSGEQCLASTPSEGFQEFDEYREIEGDFSEEEDRMPWVSRWGTESDEDVAQVMANEYEDYRRFILDRPLWHSLFKRSRRFKYEDL